MKLKFFLFLSLFTLSIQGWAGLGGRWVGWGQWTFDGQGTRCDVMTLEFREDENKLERGEGHFDCGIVALGIPAQSWLKQDQNLLSDGKAVGSYKENLYQWTEPYSPTVNVKSTILVNGRHLDYQEIWTNVQGQEIYVIKGRLFLRD